MTNDPEKNDASRASDATTAAATISADYTVTIPKALCDGLHWRPGDKLVFIPKGAGAMLMALPTRDELVGLARGANTEDYRDRNDRF